MCFVVRLMIFVFMLVTSCCISCLMMYIFFACHYVLNCFIISIFSPVYSKMFVMLYKTSQDAQNDMWWITYIWFDSSLLEALSEHVHFVMCGMWAQWCPANLESSETVGGSGEEKWVKKSKFTKIGMITNMQRMLSVNGVCVQLLIARAAVH